MNNLSCKIWGGQIIAIRSASGLIRFPRVQNADEFVNATLSKIDEYREQTKADNQSLINAVNKNTAAGSSSGIEKLKELKELLDSGIISQEDLDKKKAELLSKI